MLQARACEEKHELLQHPECFKHAFEVHTRVVPLLSVLHACISDEKQKFDLHPECVKHALEVNARVMPVPFIADHIPGGTNVTADALRRTHLPGSQFSLPQCLRDVPQAPIVAKPHVGTLQLPFAFVKTKLPEAKRRHGSLFSAVNEKCRDATVGSACGQPTKQSEIKALLLALPGGQSNMAATPRSASCRSQPDLDPIICCTRHRSALRSNWLCRHTTDGTALWSIRLSRDTTDGIAPRPSWHRFVPLSTKDGWKVLPLRTKDLSNFNASSLSGFTARFLRRALAWCWARCTSSCRV